MGFNNPGALGTGFWGFFNHLGTEPYGLPDFTFNGTPGVPFWGGFFNPLFWVFGPPGLFFLPPELPFFSRQRPYPFFLWEATGALWVFSPPELFPFWGDFFFPQTGVFTGGGFL